MIDPILLKTILIATGIFFLFIIGLSIFIGLVNYIYSERRLHNNGKKTKR